MSEFGDGEYATAWTEGWRTARKSHVCGACQETVSPGARYFHVFYVFEGSAHTVKRCERCQLIFEHLSARIRSEGGDEEFCHARLNCGHTYEDRWGHAPPEWLASLAFWRPGDPLPQPPRQP